MDLPALLLACSVHPDDRLLLAIANAFSHARPLVVMNVNLAVLDDQDEPSTSLLTPSSLEAARSITERLIVFGGDPVIGLLPVRPAWAAEFGKSPDELFDPCGDVAVASAKLSEFDYICGRKGHLANAATRRACTLDHYGSSLGLPALRVVVMAELSQPSAPETQGSDIPLIVPGSPPPTEPGSTLFFSVAPAATALPLQAPPSPSLLSSYFPASSP